MIIVWRLVLAVYLAYAVAGVIMLVRHDRRKGRRLTVLRCVAMVLFSALWPIVLTVALCAEHHERRLA